MGGSSRKAAAYPFKRRVRPLGRRRMANWIAACICFDQEGFWIHGESRGILAAVDAGIAQARPDMPRKQTGDYIAKTIRTQIRNGSRRR